MYICFNFVILWKLYCISSETASRTHSRYWRFYLVHVCISQKIEQCCHTLSIPHSAIWWCYLYHDSWHELCLDHYGRCKTRIPSSIGSTHRPRKVSFLRPRLQEVLFQGYAVWANQCTFILHMHDAPVLQRMGNCLHHQDQSHEVNWRWTYRCFGNRWYNNWRDPALQRQQSDHRRYPTMGKQFATCTLVFWMCMWSIPEVSSELSPRQMRFLER